MRPVSKGESPHVYTKYGHARGDLIDRIGHYCNYCDMALYNQPQVEHVQPKSKNVDLELEWSNFLLACGYCNSVKSDKDVNLGTDVFADTDNLLTTICMEGVKIVVKSTASVTHQDMAKKLLSLVGRDRDPYNPKNPDRWRARFSAYIQIKKSKGALQRHPDNIPLREQIVITALGYGHFPMWMDAFQNDVDMKLRLISAFPGTALDCFDTNGDPIPRPGGKM